ncbi:IclR family transcriptional regulator [Caldinitratiruptor microaerophilus]|uniref:Glycerol operon regulatory protein n=1 Tax=Caldinitratiruptor microaerophilus TaxID=671077 RepID=A0AA35CKK2_9FIRM|nr:IclR family transcriptional regulator [Caldinitratiruptor microaerophilus]BDG60128.1 IclR family transcriptional regulator [Caldinitratiruptor microaerophilus]
MPHVPALVRALDILELVAREEAISLSEVSRKLNLPRSTAHALLTTLGARGYLHRRADGKFQLGLALVGLARRVIVDVDVRDVARPVMEQLVHTVRETVHLAVLDPEDFEVVYIEKIESPMPIVLASWVGKKNPAYCTAVGKSLLAWLPEPELQRFLDRGGWQQFTPNTRATREALESELRNVRAMGYSLDREEHHLGVRCVGAPIFDRAGRAVAALSVAGPAGRMPDDRIPELAQQVRAASQLISRLLGGKV